MKGEGEVEGFKREGKGKYGRIEKNIRRGGGREKVKEASDKSRWRRK